MPALTVTPAQRSALRAAAHALNPVVLIGADGLTDAVMGEIERALVAHQLIKVRVFGDDRDERVAAYEAICERAGAAPIQHIGKLLVIWRPAPVESQRVARGERAHGGRPTRAGEVPAAAPRGPRAARPARAVRTVSPSAKSARPSAKGGAGTRVVTIVKPSAKPGQRPTATQVLVRGNERVTAGGNVKKAKKKSGGTSIKRQRQSNR